MVEHKGELQAVFEDASESPSLERSERHSVTGDGHHRENMWCCYHACSEWSVIDKQAWLWSEEVQGLWSRKSTSTNNGWALRKHAEISKSGFRYEESFGSADIENPHIKNKTAPIRKRRSAVFPKRSRMPLKIFETMCRSQPLPRRFHSVTTTTGLAMLGPLDHGIFALCNTIDEF